jgi:hypothetical protein
MINNGNISPVQTPKQFISFFSRPVLIFEQTVHTPPSKYWVYARYLWVQLSCQSQTLQNCSLATAAKASLSPGTTQRRIHTPRRTRWWLGWEYGTGGISFRDEVRITRVWEGLRSTWSNLLAERDKELTRRGWLCSCHGQTWPYMHVSTPNVTAWSNHISWYLVHK